MLKLFRKIRHNMVLNVKVGKYLLYAIGEIALVMIGILLALQVNTWNQNSKDNEKKQLYLINLVKDLQSQKSNIEDQLRFENRFDSVGRQCLKFYSDLQNPLAIDSIRHSLSQLNRKKTFSVVEVTFQDLKSTGNLSLFKGDSLKYEIGNYYQQLSHIAKIVDSNNKSFKNDYGAFITKNELGFYRKQDGTFASERIADKKYHYYLEEQLESRIEPMKWNIRNMQELRSSTTALIQKIELQIKN